MKFSRQEYWSGLPFPSLGDLPNPGIELGSPALQADSLSSEPSGKVFYLHLGMVQTSPPQSLGFRVPFLGEACDSPRNCHKLPQTWRLKTNLFLPSGEHKCETSFTGRTSSIAGPAALWRLYWENPWPCLFHLLASWIPGLRSLPPTSEPTHSISDSITSCCAVTSPSASLTTRLVTTGHSGPLQVGRVISGSSAITPAKSFLPYEVPFIGSGNYHVTIPGGGGKGQSALYGSVC